MSDFGDHFQRLTGHPPFPWQVALYEKFLDGDFPETCSLPTGLGKTSIIALWLIALAERPSVLPRRLVYVVNRRTVADQTTTEVETLRKNLDSKPELEELRAALTKLCAIQQQDGQPVVPLGISTLRGQYADNQEWSSDPARPAVICGTVDMIGSRLLFGGYRSGFKSRPLHAGFLGQDALLIHDEAHLEPAFQNLITAIECEQKRCGDFRPLRVMELTATSRGHENNAENDPPFSLSGEEQHPPDNIPDPPTEPIHHVWRRLKAKKSLTFHPVGDGRDAVAKEVAKLATRHQDSDAAVLVFVRTLEDVSTVEKELAKTKRPVVLLTGTERGKERDELVNKLEFKRFYQGTESGETVYLVCTSAGEVGIDISADHMVCDLSTFESMAQRFGRVNRYGDRNDTCIDVVHPISFGKVDKKSGELNADEIDRRRQRTLVLLKMLPALGDDQFDGSPRALSDLRQRTDLPCRIDEAFSPPPTILPATDILFDAWALTSIRKKMPGRPEVAIYLHGISEWQPPETYVAWREEVGHLTGDLLDLYKPEDLLDDYPLKPHELLRDRSDRVFKEFKSLAERHPDAPAWLVDERGIVQPVTLSQLADKRRKDRIEGKTVLLPPHVGGLSNAGMLDSDSQHAHDVADDTLDEQGRTRRRRLWDDDPIPDHLRIIRTIDTRPDADESDAEEGDTQQRYWHWCDLPREGGRTSNRSVTLATHVGDVVDHATQIVAGLSLPSEIEKAIILAAKLHDQGKRRERFQLTLGNRDPDLLLAKSRRRAAVRLPEPFRHEFASLLDAQGDADFQQLGDEMQDLVLHLIAAHHGRARPHFDRDEAFDPTPPSGLTSDEVAVEVPRRFARLQRRYGRWGLAYLESLLRAADWSASAGPSKVLDANGTEVTP